MLINICKPINNEAQMTWFNGKNNIEAMNNLVVFAQQTYSFILI
jgi:hypothetical protein